MIRAAIVIAALTVVAGAHADPAPASPPSASAPLEASIILAPSPELPAIAARLAGQSFRTGDGAIVIDDIAGAGRPWTGVVERRGDALVLVTALGALELTGPLARPRIAGPGYTVWVLGTRDGDRLAATRIGVLRRPRDKS